MMSKSKRYITDAQTLNNVLQSLKVLLKLYLDECLLPSSLRLMHFGVMLQTAFRIICSMTGAIMHIDNNDQAKYNKYSISIS